MTSPDFLVVGTTTKDLTQAGYTLGGTATYAALAVKRLGLDPAVVTSAEPNVFDDPRLSGIAYANAPSKVTTTFRNVYHGTRRIQYVEAVSSSIDYGHVPDKWQTAPLVLLGPLVDDVSEDMAARLRANAGCEKDSQIIGASIQGWLRQWDETGLVGRRRWPGTEVLPYLDVAFVSEADVADSELTELWTGLVPTLIVTMRDEGARVHHEGVWHHVPAYPVQEIDPTGAGDVFAAAFLIEYKETRDVIASARFASCAASFVVQGAGTSNFPSRPQIVERMRAQSGVIE